LEAAQAGALLELLFQCRQLRAIDRRFAAELRTEPEATATASCAQKNAADQARATLLQRPPLVRGRLGTQRASCRCEVSGGTYSPLLCSVARCLQLARGLHWCWLLPPAKGTPLLPDLALPNKLEVFSLAKASLSTEKIAASACHPPLLPLQSRRAG
jgi:hypothetical protein